MLIITYKLYKHKKIHKREGYTWIPSLLFQYKKLDDKNRQLWNVYIKLWPDVKIEWFL